MVLLGRDQQAASFTFSTEQKEQIARLSGIPLSEDDAWAMIEGQITIYRSRKAGRRYEASPAQIRHELNLLHKEIGKIFQRLVVLQDRSLLYADYSFKVERHLLNQVDLRFVRLMDEIDDGKRGPSTRDIYIFVSSLDGIRQEFTGKKIKRSAKRDTSREYVQLVCKIADPEIGKGTIENAIKNRITSRGRIAPSV